MIWPAQYLTSALDTPTFQKASSMPGLPPEVDFDKVPSPRVSVVVIPAWRRRLSVKLNVEWEVAWFWPWTVEAAAVLSQRSTEEGNGPEE